MNKLTFVFYLLLIGCSTIQNSFKYTLHSQKKHIVNTNDNTINSSIWACEQCTFHNSSFRSKCEICGTSSTIEEKKYTTNTNNNTINNSTGKSKVKIGFFHGLNSSISTLNSIVDKIQENKSNSIIYKESRHNNSLEKQALSALKIIKQYNKPENTINLIGHSMGCTVLIEVLESIKNDLKASIVLHFINPCLKIDYNYLIKAYNKASNNNPNRDGRISSQINSLINIDKHSLNQGISFLRNLGAPILTTIITPATIVQYIFGTDHALNNFNARNYSTKINRILKLKKEQVKLITYRSFIDRIGDGVLTLTNMKVEGSHEDYLYKNCRHGGNFYTEKDFFNTTSILNNPNLINKVSERIKRSPDLFS